MSTDKQCTYNSTKINSTEVSYDKNDIETCWSFIRTESNSSKRVYFFSEMWQATELPGAGCFLPLTNNCQKRFERGQMLQQHLLLLMQLLVAICWSHEWTMERTPFDLEVAVLDKISPCDIRAKQTTMIRVFVITMSLLYSWICHKRACSKRQSKERPTGTKWLKAVNTH